MLKNNLDQIYNIYLVYILILINNKNLNNSSLFENHKYFN